MMPSPTRGGVLDWADDTWAQVRAHGGVGGGGVTCGAQVEVTAGAARFLRVRLPSFLPELDHLSRGSVAQNFRVKKMKRFKNFMGSPSSCISVLAGFI